MASRRAASRLISRRLIERFLSILQSGTCLGRSWNQKERDGRQHFRPAFMIFFLLCDVVESCVLVEDVQRPGQELGWV